jgi:hypothetical protein
MALYVFRSLTGKLVQVEASNQTSARHEAMVELHGHPKPLVFPKPGTKEHLVIGEPVYFGEGLDLISVGVA